MSKKLTIINYLGLKLKIRHGAIVENIFTNLCARFNDEHVK